MTWKGDWRISYLYITSIVVVQNMNIVLGA